MSNYTYRDCSWQCIPQKDCIYKKKICMCINYRGFSHQVQLEINISDYQKILKFGDESGHTKIDGESTVNGQPMKFRKAQP